MALHTLAISLFYKMAITNISWVMREAIKTWYPSSACCFVKKKKLQEHPNQDKSAQISLVVTYHWILLTFKSFTKLHLLTLHISEWLQEVFLLLLLISLCRLRNLKVLLVPACFQSSLGEKSEIQLFCIHLP